MAGKINAMYSVYGKGSGRCGDCPHFLEGYYHDRKYFKCVAYGLSHSEATDWRKKWSACGLIGKPLPVGDRPVKERFMGRKRDDQPLPGQMDIDDLLPTEE